MNPLAFIPTRFMITLLGVTGLCGGVWLYGHSRYDVGYAIGQQQERSAWQKLAAAQQAEAQLQLAAAQQAAQARAAQLSQINQKLQEHHDAQQQKIDQALADNRALARQLGGLRDPGRTLAGDGSDGPLPAAANAASSPANSTASTALSAEATDFLLGFATEADRAAEYATECREWSIKIGSQ